MYYRDLLQLDHNRKAKNVMQVNDLVSSGENKFKWRMMLISMKDVKVLIEFFKSHVVNIKRGAKVLLERIEDFSEMAIGGGVADFSGIPSATSATPMASVHLDDDMFAGSGIGGSMANTHEEMPRSATMSSVRDDHFATSSQDLASANYVGGLSHQARDY